MVGNIPELTNPEDIEARYDIYPHVEADNNGNIPIPSIRGRKLYIPMEAFFCESSKLALPLVALQYQEVFIRITFEPIQNLFIINDTISANSSTGLSARVRPNFAVQEHDLWRFYNRHQNHKHAL